MNKGTAQELALCESIRRELRKKRFGLIPECCQVFHQRAYFSRDRNADILVDVAIEVTLPGAPAPLFVWVWESKNHSSPLSVDHVEEFHAKLQQIGADRTKGTIALRGEIQKSALEYAVAKGIGIARFLPSNRIQFVQFCRSETKTYYFGMEESERKAREQQDEARKQEEERARHYHQTLSAMTDPTYISYNDGFFALTFKGKAFRGGFEQYLQLGFVDLFPCNVWRTDLEGWHWRRGHET